MKKIGLLLVLCLFVVASSRAQLFKSSNKTIDAKYAAGAVPLVGNRVLFEEEIAAQGLTAAQVFEKVDAWAKSRFVKPTVIEVKTESENNILSISAEEYMVFTKKLLNFDRTRINYFLQLVCEDGKCIMRMTRIKYWYEEERDGGSHFTAEERITDEAAMNKKRTKFYRGYGKFRTKTIDLKDSLADDISKTLNN